MGCLRKLVVFVDDEPVFQQEYLEALRQHFDVAFYSRAADAMNYITEHYKRIAVLVLDAMMPTPPNVAVDVTEDGLSTGIWLLQQVLTTLSDTYDEARAPFPIVLLTNRSPDAVKDGLNRCCVPHEGIVIRLKEQTEPADLVVLLTSLRDGATDACAGPTRSAQ